MTTILDEAATLRRRKCRSCGKVWLTIVPHPYYCPECKMRLAEMCEPPIPPKF